MRELRPRRIIKRGKTRWEVDFGIDETGVRRRPNFATEDEAKAAIEAYEKGLKRYGDWWLRRTPLEKKVIAVTCQQIEDAGLTLERVWGDWQKWNREQGQKPTIQSVPYVEAVAEFKRRKLAAGKSSRYVDETFDLLSEFGKGREQQLICNITPDELDQWIENHKGREGKAWSLNSKRTHRTRFSSLWSVAVDKGICSGCFCWLRQEGAAIEGAAQIFEDWEAVFAQG